MLSTEITQKIRQMLESAHGARPLYLTLFGSQLYGTAIEGKSDLDVKGIFLPPADSLLLMESKKGISFSTGDETGKNHAEDVDIDLWSIQHWLLKLLPSGDTGALDLLFSPTNKAAVIYMDPGMAEIFENFSRLINLKGQNGYAAYSMGQAKKYGIRGSRLGIVKKAWAWLEKECPNPDKKERFDGEIFERFASNCHDDKYCFVIRCNGGDAIQLCGKIHLRGMPLWELKKRIGDHYRIYGQRAVLADQNHGLDFKALSHAVRALEQIRELAQTGRVIYPLACAPLLREIKTGKYAWADLEPMIVKKLEEADALCNAASATAQCSYDQDFAKKMVLKFYGM